MKPLPMPAPRLARAVRPILACVAAALAASVALSARAADDGFRPLFNGTDLTGWTGDARYWSVEEGTIVGSSMETPVERNTFLSTVETYADFVLRVDVKLGNHNSGIQFRSERHPDHVVKGYQADIAANYFGMIYEEGKRGFMPYWKELDPAAQAEIVGAAKLDDWNAYEITCVDDSIRIVLNGKTVCDIVDPEGAREGVIALQIHSGDPMKVWFRNVSIRELNTGPKEYVTPSDVEPLLPDQTTRVERSASEGRRFVAPEGFSIEEVAGHDMVNSVVNMTFDAKGRPALSLEHGGINLLIDENGDGKADRMHEFAGQVKTAHGMHYVAPGDLIVNANGPEGTALYRLRDEDGDDTAERIDTIALSRGGIGEHGPHTILTGFDGALYVLYGNHAFPDVSLDPFAPSRDLQEDQALTRYVDPRGHATTIRAPGGTIHRLDLETNLWSQFCGGFRNPFDMAVNEAGEIMAFDSDMEWDFGLPWYRPIRVVHCVPGGDYGWRTGSGKFPDHYIDTLPPTEDVGRGSPVGVAFYEHDVYPEKYRGAIFLGDWSRGRIRVGFYEPAGATFKGGSTDFVRGEPLNVSDLDVGPDGFLYFSTGGRSTTGGVYRVRYSGGAAPAPAEGVRAALAQPMHRSAYGKARILETKATLGDQWAPELRRAAKDPAAPPRERVRALELLHVYGGHAGIPLLTAALADGDASVRAAAARLLGAYPLAESRPALAEAVADADPLVARIACESLVWSGIEKETAPPANDPLPPRLFALLDHSDRFVRTAARHALSRMNRGAWVGMVIADDVSVRPRGALEGLVALIQNQTLALDADTVFGKLIQYADRPMDEETLLGYLRVVQLALIRDSLKGENAREGFKRRVGQRMLALYPHESRRASRELEVVLAQTGTTAAIPKMLDELTPYKSQEEQIHVVYTLTEIKSGWTRGERERLVKWFDRGREFGGAASMEGYVENLWQATLAILPEDQKKAAEERKQAAILNRALRAEALASQVEGDKIPGGSDLAQMSFKELADYLEFDPMTWEKGSAERGKLVFQRARCANCHVFGDVGKGGGPDLSTVVKRFRRREILEAIMYPSKVISDQYQAFNVETEDDVINGFVAGEDDATLTLINSAGEKIEIPKETIKDRRPSTVSIMPDGLLGTMTLGDLANLMLFLEEGSGL